MKLVDYLYSTSHCSNGDLSVFFYNYNYGNDNVKSYIKMTVNQNSDMNGTVRFQLKILLL